MELPANHFKRALKAGKPPIGIWSSLRSHVKAPGILVGEADGQRCLDMGYLFVAVGSDIGLLRTGDALAAKFKQ